MTSAQVRHLASVVKSCGEDGCADITTRQNLQLRGIELKDTPEIIQGVMVGRCRLTVSKPMLKAPFVSALEATM